MKKILLVIMLLTVISGMVMVSAESIGTFKQNKEMQITNYCNSGDCTYANLTTLQLPDGSVATINELMSKNGQSFNYSYMPTQIGVYTFKSCADPGGVVVCDSDTFEISPDGFTSNIGYYIIWIILSLGIIWFGYHTQDAWVVILGAFGLVLFGLYVMFYGFAGMKDTVYTWGMGIITLMLGAYFGIRGALENIE